MTTIHRSVPSYTEADNVTGCCPVFHPEEYDDQMYDLSEYEFIKDSTLSFMYMPLNMDKVFTRVVKAIDDSKQGYTDRNLILSQDVSPFKCNHFFLAKGSVEGYESHHIEGQYYTKVYEGDFKDMQKWVKDFQSIFTLKNKALKQMFVYYTTCPNCAKVYGHNYVVLFGKIE